MEVKCEVPAKMAFYKRVCVCVQLWDVAQCSLRSPRHPHTAYGGPIQLTPPPICAPRCTEAESRMEQGAVCSDSDIHRMQ